MPEGHTVHRLARAFGELFGGDVLRASSPQGRFAGGAELLDGRTLLAADAHGKQLFATFAPRPGGAPARGDDEPVGAVVLRVHLGLYGAWTFSGDQSADVVHAIGAPRRRIGEYETSSGPGASADADAPGTWEVPEPRGAVRLRLLGAHAAADLTGPTACEVLTPAEAVDVIDELGPDPIRWGAGGRDPRDDPDRFVDAVRRSRTAIGVRLMDQSVVAGVGNIYRAEALYRARLDPFRPGAAVPEEDVRAVWDDLCALMLDGVARGAIVTTDPEHREPGGTVPGHRVRQNTDADSEAVPPDEAFYVYHREGLPCRVCGNPVLVRAVAGRKLYWCGTCQV